MSSRKKRQGAAPAEANATAGAATAAEASEAAAQATDEQPKVDPDEIMPDDAGDDAGDQGAGAGGEPERQQQGDDVVVYLRGDFTMVPEGTRERFYGFDFIADAYGHRVARLPAWAMPGMLKAGRVVEAPPGTEVPIPLDQRASTASGGHVEAMTDAEKRKLGML